MARYVIEQGGVVYGAFCENAIVVRHLRIERLEELNRLRGSKYIQSEIGLTFRNVKADLLDERMVLFSGTPCQIYGLMAYLEYKNYKNLVTVDLVCHGTISANAIKTYVCARKQDPEQVKVQWTNKKTGWHQRSIVITDRSTNEVLFEEIYNRSTIGQVYANNICLNDSCYHCDYRYKQSAADVTLGDYWGIEKVAPEMDDDQGVSLVIVHTSKAEALIEAIRTFLEMSNTPIEKAEQGQCALTSAAHTNINRQMAIEILMQEGIEAVYKKLCKKNLLQRLVQKLRTIRQHRTIHS